LDQLLAYGLFRYTSVRLKAGHLVKEENQYINESAIKGI